MGDIIKIWGEYLVRALHRNRVQEREAGELGQSRAVLPWTTWVVPELGQERGKSSQGIWSEKLG